MRKMGPLSLGSVLLLVTLLLGCRARADGPVVLDFWGIGVEGELIKELVPDFEREHPGVRVRVQQIPWTAAHEKLLTAFVGNATPDLCQLGNTWVPEFVALEALEPLDALVAQSAVVDQADYFSGIWDTNRLEGRVYGIPWYVDTRLVFYRTDLFRKAGYAAPPDTWTEWAEALRRVKAQGADYGVLLPTNEWQHPVSFALQTQPDLLRDHDQYGNFSSPEFRKAFTYYVGLFDDGLAPALGTTQISNVYQEFSRGYIAAFLTGPWNIGEFKRRLPDSLQGDWMTAPMPGPVEGEKGISVAGGSSLVLFAGSEKKAEAWQFIEFLSRPDVQARFYELSGDLPPRETAWSTPLLEQNPYAGAFREQLRHVRPTPKVPEWERIATKIYEYTEAAIRGDLTIDEALAALDRDVDRILEKRRYLLSRKEKR